MPAPISTMFPLGAQTGRGAFEGMSAPDTKTLDSPGFQVVSQLGQAIESGKKDDLQSAVRMASVHGVGLGKMVFAPTPHQRLTPVLAMMSRDNMVQWRQAVRALESHSAAFSPADEFACFRLQGEDKSWELGPKLPFEHAALVLMGLFFNNQDNHEKKQALIDKLFSALDKLGMNWNRLTDGNDDTPLMVLSRYCTGYAFGHLYPKVKERGGDAWVENCDGECAASHIMGRLESTSASQYGNVELHINAMKSFQVELRARRLDAVLPSASRSASSPRM